MNKIIDCHEPFIFLPFEDFMDFDFVHGFAISLWSNWSPHKYWLQGKFLRFIYMHACLLCVKNKLGADINFLIEPL